MLATFMEVIDTSIASVALPHIAGSLSATNDEATWVLTSYLVANAIILPARAVQGAGGGALQPISQAILLESFPPEKRGSAMAVFALGVVVAPILGPTLGGYLTDTYSWRWAFSINIPIGILALFMINRFIFD